MIKLKRSNITIICNLIFVLWEIIICFGKRIGSSRDHLFIFQFYYVNLLTYKNSGGKVTILDLFTRKNNNNNKKKTCVIVLEVDADGLCRCLLRKVKSPYK